MYREQKPMCTAAVFTRTWNSLKVYKSTQNLRKVPETRVKYPKVPKSTWKYPKIPKSNYDQNGQKNVQKWAKMVLFS